MTELTTEVSLGDDSDCELCGWSFNELRYAFDLSTGVHTLEISLGCYGGERFSTDDKTDAVAFIRGYVAEYPGADVELVELAEGINERF